MATAKQKLAKLVEKGRVRDLRRELANAKRRRRDALAEARKLCKAERQAVRDRIKSDRQRAREQLNARKLEELAEVTAGCRRRRDKTKGPVLDIQRRLSREREFQGQLRKTGQEAVSKARAQRSKERREESDDAVKRNVPPEYWPIWQRVKSDIQGGPRKSRTEAFWQWLEENPDEVVAVRDSQVDQDVNRLIAELEDAQAAEAAAVPF